MMKSTPWRIGKNSPTTPKPINSQPITSTTIRLICRSIDGNNTFPYLVPRPTDVHAVVDAEGLDFEETTELSTISSQEAVFWLKNKVVIGSKMVLSLNVPKTLILENQLNLIVSGEVIFASTDPSTQDKQLVSIQLDRLYKIQPIYTSR